MIFRSSALLVLLFFSGIVQSALIGGLPSTSGGTDYQVYYDDVLDITWLADANLSASNTFGVSGIDAAGKMNWDSAVSFVAAMNAANYLGSNQWRLPAFIDIDNDGCVDDFSYSGTDCGYNVVSTGPNASEMASLFYETLDNIAFFDEDGNAVSGGGLQNTGPFSNLKSKLYWYGQELNGDASQAWYFGMPSGAQRPREKTRLHFVLPVVDGNYFGVAVVPVPSAIWLFGSALGLFGWLRSRKA